MEKNKVLIVDDISENIETISEMIKDFDIDVKTANGGKEAIELIDSFKPDVILLDLMMPNVNGWDVIDLYALNTRKVKWSSSWFPC